MDADLIATVGIDPEQRLFVQPARHAFPDVYRAGADVRWDADRSVLVTDAPREVSYVNCFRRIWSAAAGEYGVDLRLSDQTNWVGAPDDLRLAIQGDDGWRELQRVTLTRKPSPADVARWALQMRAPNVRSGAAEAFRSGRYAEAARLLAEIEPLLTSAERIKLDIARQRANQT